jgi:hypothetical protein
MCGTFDWRLSVTTTQADYVQQDRRFYPDTGIAPFSLGRYLTIPATVAE